MAGLRPPYELWTYKDIMKHYGFRSSYSCSLIRQFPSPYKARVDKNGDEGENYFSKLIVRAEEFKAWFKAEKHNGSRGLWREWRLERRPRIITHKRGDILPVYEIAPSRDGLIAEVKLLECKTPKNSTDTKHFGLARWLCEHAKGCDCDYCTRARLWPDNVIEDNCRCDSCLEKKRKYPNIGVKSNGNYLFTHILSVWDKEFERDIPVKYVSLKELETGVKTWKPSL